MHITVACMCKTLNNEVCSVHFNRCYSYECGHSNSDQSQGGRQNEVMVASRTRPGWGHKQRYLATAGKQTGTGDRVTGGHVNGLIPFEFPQSITVTIFMC